MVHKTVLKVNISCSKCKTKILKAVSGLEGVDKVEVDDAKGTVTVTGDADPYKIVVRIKKTKKLQEIVSIGPPPKPDAQKKPEEKKPEVKKIESQPQPYFYVHHSCPSCDNMNYRGGDSCSII